jgi:hypothetical protein
VAATGVWRRRTRTAAVTAPTAIDAPAIRIVARDQSRSPGRARRMGPFAPGRRAPSPRRTQHPDGSNAGDLVKARGGDPGHQPRGKHRQEAAAFKQGMELPQLGATHDRRLELRASRGSCQREGSEHRPRERRRREQDPRPEGDRGRRDPAAPSSPAPGHRRVAIRLTGRAVHAGERTRHRDRAQ